MKAGKKWLLGAGAMLALGLLADWAMDRLSAADSYVKGTEDRSTFYRLKVGLSHEGERIDFDIVVGCAVRVTNYQDNDRSFDAISTPVTYMKRIHGGHGVLIFPGRFCGGETTENGKVPDDFLPRVVWYEDAEDWLLGIGYYSMDAYENPRSQLAFHGASVHKATRAEWEAFLPRAGQENLVPQENYFRPGSGLDETALKKIRWNMQAYTRHFAFYPRCYGVRRFELDEPEARAILSKYWPDSKPRYWSVFLNEESGTPFIRQIVDELWALNQGKGARIDGKYLKNFFNNEGLLRGLPGRSGRSAIFPVRHANEYYPTRRDDAAPWLTPEQVAEGLAVRFELDEGRNKGFLYCYKWLGRGGRVFDLHLTKADTAEMPCLVDGQRLHWPEKTCTFEAYHFFEEDKAFYWTTRY